MASFRTVVRPVMREVIVAPARMARELQPDAVIAHPKVLSGRLIAQALEIPGFVAELVPILTPTGEFPAAGTVTGNLGRGLNRLTYRAGSGAAAMFRGDLAEARRVLGLTDPLPRTPEPSLMPVSPHLLSRPADWPESTHLTGAWTSARGDAASVEVERFIAGGPFVYAGFGSMSFARPRALGEAIVVAARAQGLRALIVTGLGAIDVPDHLRGDDVLLVDQVPHDAVLPHAVAAVHHGGVGTVHAAARAGTTSVVVPFFADQPFWGALLHREGLAPAPIPVKRLTAQRLEHALAEVSRYRAKNRELGPKIDAERGAATALDLIEAVVGV